MPFRLSSDASSMGIGAVIAHCFPDGLVRPVVYASRSLSKSKNNYSQTEKEGLAIVYWLKKFYQFLYGWFFTFVTDHKPLVTIFGAKQGIPPIAAARFSVGLSFCQDTGIIFSFRGLRTMEMRCSLSFTFTFWC